MASDRPTARLSKSILEMKFMKRTKEKVQKETDDAKSREMYSNEITAKMKSSESRYIIESSYIFCEDLNDGRFSFRGMNTDIEKILESEEAAKKGKQDQNVEKDVTDAEMQNNYYVNTSNTIKRKFQSKSERKKMTLPEPKFKKPRVD